jgi:hypothetical protein
MPFKKYSNIEGSSMGNERTDFEKIQEFGLPLDYINEWYALTIIVEAGSDNFESLQPIQPVADFISHTNHSPAFKELALKQCNQKKVSEIDALASEFNGRLEEIKRERKVDVLMEFYWKAKRIYDSK